MRRIGFDNPEYSFAISPHRAPIAEICTGERVEILLEDAFSSRIRSNTDVPSEKLAGVYSNPLVGPIRIVGACPGDTLKIHIISMERTRDWAVSCIQQRFGALVNTEVTRMLNPPLPERTYIYRAEGNVFAYDDALRFPWKPFIGTIGTAHAIEATYSVNASANGGNLDLPDVAPGNILYLPVCIDGAYLYLGDMHANQGYGEICGSGLEISGKVALEFELLKGNSIASPRIESPDALICIGVARPLEDAARIACCEMVQWLGELGWEQMDAYQALGQALELYAGNIVDNPYCMAARISKELAYRKVHA